MEKYASFTSQDDHVYGYLTANKKYNIIEEDYFGGFRIKSDTGQLIYCLFKGCSHLEYNDWTITEIKN